MTSPGFGFRKRLCPKMEKSFKLSTPQKEEIVKRTVCDEAVTYKNKQGTIAEVHGCGEHLHKHTYVQCIRRLYHMHSKLCIIASCVCSLVNYTVSH